MLLSILTPSSPMTDLTSIKVAILVGTTVLPSLVYGINLTLIVMILHLLWKGRTADTRKHTLLVTTYVALLCALCAAHWVLSWVGEAISLVQPPGEGIWPLTIVTFDSIYLTLTCLTDGLLVRVDD